ncbi:hypothetical protein ACI48J_19380 [Paenibacillus chitinolyticus]|uniref:hypothetical protein n=2 Tax=Paenibacillus TaxID=44249 RepID=UPI002DBB1C6E|nr:hypothetical protein [Paenibacillus chitinolyticus]MEC0248976.1 hypothetical protein [Paenibacillus chitinolyticus]
MATLSGEKKGAQADKKGTGTRMDLMYIAAAAGDSGKSKLSMEYLMQSVLLVIIVVIMFVIMLVWSKWSKKRRRK